MPTTRWIPNLLLLTGLLISGRALAQCGYGIATIAQCFKGSEVVERGQTCGGFDARHRLSRTIIAIRDTGCVPLGRQEHSRLPTGLSNKMFAPATGEMEVTAEMEGTAEVEATAGAVGMAETEGMAEIAAHSAGKKVNSNLAILGILTLQLRGIHT